MHELFAGALQYFAGTPTFSARTRQRIISGTFDFLSVFINCLPVHLNFLPEQQFFPVLFSCLQVFINCLPVRLNILPVHPHFLREQSK
jgi:hypothetical protein